MKVLVTAFSVVIMILGCAATSQAALKVGSLCELHYPTDYLYEWDCVQIRSGESPRYLFGKHWQDGLRFNRMDRRHFIAGLWIKMPRHMRDIRDFNPMPAFYPEAEREPQFILIDQNEMYLGAYEYGKLVFSTPVAVGLEGHRLQNGSYRVDAVDPRHESSLYLMEGTERPYPMHFALRFYTDKRVDGWTTYWLHGRDIPGYPASHGCIGLYDEEMQKEYYSEPDRPILTDARKLYIWALGTVYQDTGTFQTIENGPKVVIMGTPPEVFPEPEQGAPGVTIVPAATRPQAKP
jgi:hypothetical protein